MVRIPSRFTIAYKHPLILDIFGHVLTIWLACLFIALFSRLFKNCKTKILAKIYDKIKENFVYNGLIRMLMESCIYIFLACFLNFRHGVAVETHSILNICISAIFMLMMVIFLVVAYVIISKSKSEEN